MKVKYLLGILLVFGCGRAGERSNTQPNSDLENKLSTYLDLYPNQADSYGFPLADKCDGLLWASLHAVSGGYVNLQAAETHPGEWIRNPDNSCFSISRDMMLGLLLYIWQNRDLQKIEDLISYGESHGFAMSPQVSDGGEIMSPDIIATMYLLRDKLGGSKSIAEDFSQAWWIPNQVGFLAHLQVLHIFIRGLANGSVTEGELNILENYANLNPDNAVYNSVYHRFKDGDQSKATVALMNTTWFPVEELPTNSNYCEGVYLFQRDEYTSDWQPCGGNNIKPGIDFSFAAAIVLDIVK